jgi:hypothetical protein
MSPTVITATAVSYSATTWSLSTKTRPPASSATAHLRAGPTIWFSPISTACPALDQRRKGPRHDRIRPRHSVFHPARATKIGDRAGRLCETGEGGRSAHRGNRRPRYSATVGCPFAPVGIITASFGEASCVNAFSSCGLNPGSRPPQRAPGKAWRSVRFWNRLGRVS